MTKENQKEVKHSSTPWETVLSSNMIEKGVRNSGGFICFLPEPFHYDGQDKRYEEELEETEANANLIAVAPELLEALKDALILLRQTNVFNEKGSFRSKIELAILKAEGGAS